MRKDEGEEVNAEVGEDVAHPPVGVHGAVDDLSGDAGEQQGSSKHSGLGLFLYLWKVFGQPHVGQFESQKWSKY